MKNPRGKAQPEKRNRKSTTGKAQPERMLQKECHRKNATENAAESALQKSRPKAGLLYSPIFGRLATAFAAAVLPEKLKLRAGAAPGRK